MTRKNAILGRLALILLGPMLAVGTAEVVVRAFLPHRDPLIVFDRELGWTHPRDLWVRYEGNGFSTRTYFNREGLRGPEIHSADAGRARILLLGDSMVEGIHVADSEVITAKIQVLLEQGGIPAEVLNAGVSGYGTLQESLYAARLIPKLHPTVAVLFVTVGNDLKDNVDRYGGRRPIAVVRGNGTVEIESPNISRLSLFARTLLQHSQLAYALREAVARIPFLSRLVTETGLAHVDADVSTAREEQGLRILQVLLPRMRDHARDGGIRCFVVVTIPEAASVQAPPAEQIPRRTWVHAGIQRTCGQQGLDCLDLYDRLRETYLRTGHQLFSEAFGSHWTAAGHAIAAEAVVPRLLDRCGPILSPTP